MLPGNEPIKTRDGDDEMSVLQEIRERAAHAVEAWQHNFDAAVEDVEFLAGAQWPDAIRKEREDEGRPCLVLNKLPQYVDQVLGDQRQNRPAISVHPVEANKTGDGQVPNIAGNNDYDLAEVYEALIRNIEYTSNAEAHYDTAFQHAVEGGFGWLRVLTKYSSDDAFEQDLCIKSIHNRFAVLMDPEAIEPDYCDANWCFIGDKMKRTEFRKRYPDAALGDLTDADRAGYAWWTTEEMVRVAEYFYREPVTRTLLLLSDGRTVWEDQVKPVLDELARDFGITVIRQRKVKTYKVKWMKVTAYSVLEGPIDWPGQTIPVVPVLGKEITLGDKTYYRGLIRFAKDAQRMHNFWMTAATERVALAPKAPYTGPVEAFEGLEFVWANANRDNRSYLPYNAVPSGDRPRREQPATMPAAELQLAMSATDEMKATVGMYDASIGNQSNETSGKAILARQRQGDRGTFAYIDNLSRAIRRTGQLLIELIPRIYDSERVLRLRFEDGEGDWVQINQTVQDEQTGKDILVNDIAAGKFDVTVKSGPSYQTQRMEAAESLMQFVQAVPQAGQVVLDLIAKNMDWPGSQEISKRLKKALPPGILEPDEMEEAGIQPPQPNPEQQAAMAKAQADTAEAEADMAGAEADKAKAQADTMKAQADMAEAEAKMAEIQMNAQMAGPGTIEETVRNLVAEAMAELMAEQSG
ncbi:MAG: portal protein [Pseudomonadota bacterium]